QVDPATKQVYKEEILDGKYFARVFRRFEGLPVWSSNMILGLADHRRIGYLQLHWPELPSLVIHEAHVLAHRVLHGWVPPEQPGAQIESIEAGIVHSAAIGFIMDISAVVRVVYRPDSKAMGKKPLYYFDRHGKRISPPRQAEMNAELRKQRR